jgi:hypothetical protein
MGDAGVEMLEAVIGCTLTDAGSGPGGAESAW